jgi:hypothetical protein
MTTGNETARKGMSIRRSGLLIDSLSGDKPPVTDFPGGAAISTKHPRVRSLENPDADFERRASQKRV